MTTFIEEFTAENLEAAIAEAIQLQEEAEGIKAVSYVEQRESYQSEALDFDSIFAEVNEVGNRLAAAGYLDELLELIEKHLGKGKKVADTKPSQVDLLSLLLIDAKELLEELQV